MKNKNRLLFSSLITVAFAAALFTTPSAKAATIYWDGTSATWNTAANWSTASGATTPNPTAVPGAADSVIFNITTVNGAETITLGADQAASSITFNNTGTTALTGGGTARTLSLGTGGITMASTAGAVTLADGTTGNNVLISLAGVQTWTNNSANAFTINDNAAAFTRVAGATLDFSQVGAGVFSINATTLPNDATGIVGPWAFFGTGTSMKYAVNNSGTIGGFTGSPAADANAFVSASTNYDFSTTTSTTLSTSRTANTIHYTGTGGITDLSTTAVTNNLTLNGILATGSGTLTIQRTAGSGTVVIGTSNELLIAGQQAVTISAPISGASGALTYSGSNTLTLSGTNTYGGGTIVTAGGLTLSGSGTLGASSGAVTVNGGTLNLGGLTITKSGFTLSSGTFRSGTINIGSATALISGTGAITNSGIITSNAVTVSGTGNNLSGGGFNIGSGGVTIDTSAGSSTAGQTGSISANLTASQTWYLTNTANSNGGRINLGTLTTNGNTLSVLPGIGTSGKTFDVKSANTFGTEVTFGAIPTFYIDADVTINGTNNSMAGITFNSAGRTLNFASMGLTSGNSSIGTGANGTLIYNNSGTANYTGGNFTSDKGLQNKATTGTSTFNVTTSGQTLSLSGALTSTGATTTAGWAFGGAGNLTLSGVISNSTGTGTPAIAVTVNGTGTLTLSNIANTYTGVTTITSGTMSVGTLANGGSNSSIGASTNAAANLVFDGGTLKYTGASLVIDRAFTINALKTATIDTTNDLTLAGATGAATTGALTKTGVGTLTLNGANTFTGGVTVNQGTLTLDMVTNNTGVLASSNTLTLGGSTLNVIGRTGAFTSSQTLGNLTLNAGASKISLTPNSGTSTTLTLGNTWTKNPGGTLLIDLSAPGTGTLTSSPTLSNSIVGGHVIVKDATGTGFATVTSGNVVRYTGATPLAGTLATDTVSATNYQITANSLFNGSSATQTVNSIDIGSGFQLGSGSAKTLVVGSGGVVFTGATFSSIASNLSVTSGTSELDVYNSAGQAQIYGVVKDNGGTSVSVVKSGTNTLFMANVLNSYTGDTVINQGSIEGLAGVPNGVGKGNLVVNSGGTANMGGSSATINGLSNTTATGGSVTSSFGGAKTLTLGNADATASFNGVISGNGANALSLIKTGTGTQTFSGANTYTGGTTISGGRLVLSNNSAAGNSTGLVAVSGANSVLEVSAGNTIANNITVSDKTASVVRKVASSGTYDVGTSGALKSSFTGGTDTTAKILAGTNSGAAATLTMSFSDTTPIGVTNDAIRQSDIFSVNGTGSDLYVLQLTASSIGAGDSLGYKNGTIWDLAISGNTGSANNATFAQQNYAGSFTAFQTAFGSTLAAYKGAYGIDTASNNLWAVVNYGGTFTAVPEPTSALAGLLITAGLLRRRRKN